MLGMFGRARRKGLLPFRRNDSGAAAVEFALVAPVFFMMLVIVVETGLMLFTEYVLQTGVQEAARKVRTGQAQEAKMSAADFKAEVCRLSSKMIDCQGRVTVYMRADTNFTNLANNTPGSLTVGKKLDGTTDPDTFQCGTPSQSVALIATYDWEFNVPIIGTVFGNARNGTVRRLVGFALFKNEPFPTVAGNVCSAS
jgi:Flp pilus assembly protein TadG